MTVMPASIARAEHGLERLGRHRHDGERVDALGDHVLDQRRLLLRVGLGRAHLEGVRAGVGGILLDAFLHAVEPLDAGDLHDGGDRRLVLRHGRRSGDERGAAIASSDTDFFIGFLPCAPVGAVAAVPVFSGCGPV
jgi:hypothetical protein